MANIVFRNGNEIGDYKRPYIVAEVNTSHGGNMNIAKEMIEQASEAGCSCVKFQSWSEKSICSKTFYDNNPIAKRFFKKFAFSEEQLSEVAEYSKNLGIAFASTPYSISEVDFLLEKCNVPFIKVASMDLNNYPFLEYIAKTGAPIVLATGMSDLSEIKSAISTIENAGNQNICLLHCISIYPPETKTINLNNIIGLRQHFAKYPIGFSDHSLGIEMASAATALGVAVIEKHLTLDKRKIGMDNQMAIEPKEMKQLVKNCENIQIALGSNERTVLEEEIKQRMVMRRSIIVNKDLPAGTVLSLGDLDSKRPGGGIEPGKIKEIVGKTLTRDIEADTLLFYKDIQ